MHHPIWKSKKFSFQAFQLIILLATTVTSNAGALRSKRETSNIVLASTPSNEEHKHGVTTPPTKNVTESNFISMETTELEQAPTIADFEMAMDVDIQATPFFPKSAVVTDDEASKMSIATQSQKLMNLNDSVTTPTVKHADVTPMVVATSSPTSEKLTDIPTKVTTPTTTTSSTRIVATTTPKSTENLLLTTLSEKLEEIATTTETETTAQPMNLSEAVTIHQSGEAEENFTTESLINFNSMTTTVQVAETTVVDAGRQTSNTNGETTSPNQVDETTAHTEDTEIGTTLLNPDLTSNEIQSTTGLYVDVTNQSDIDVTTIKDSEYKQSESVTLSIITIDATTIMTGNKSETVKTINYDVAINEIRNNSTNVDDALVIGDAQARNKYTVEAGEQIIPATTPVITSISSTSLKTKTTKSHKFIGSPEIIKTNDVENIEAANHTFTSMGTGAANSIENTLEAGQVDESVSNKIENKGRVPHSTETKQSIKMFNSTPSIVDILIPSTPSIEKNRVEDIDDLSNPSERNKHTTTTERVQNSIPSSITPLVNLDNQTTDNFVDTTTRRIERSTSIPTIMSATTQKIMNITTASNAMPLSAMPVDHDLETTTADNYAEPKRVGLTTTERQNIATDNKLLITPVETTVSPPTTSRIPTSDSVTTVESSDLNAIVTSIQPLETIPIATTVPASTTPMQTSKHPPTKPRSKPPVLKETPAPAMNTTHIVSTESVEEYLLQPRTNHTRESNSQPNLGSPAIEPNATTSEFPVTATTEKVTTSEPNEETDYNVIIAISVSVVGIVALILLVGFLYVMRKRQKSISYGQRCRPVSLDAYSLDNVSIFNSVRRKGALRASKRSYGNAAFDDPSLKHNTMSIHELAKFVDRKMTIYEEFKDVPQIIARPDEVPPGCEDKNRYANVIPLPETRVILNRIGEDEKTEYINANFVRGPKDPANYYIACQAPLESTVADFWRMIWEQNSRVIVMATDLYENGAEKSAEYIPASMTLDNCVVHGDYQITLKSREVKEKYVVSMLHVKNISLNRWREVTHFWYQWPETGVPSDEASVIAMLVEARSYLKMGTPEQSDEDVQKSSNDADESGGSIDKTKSLSKTQGPLTVHCSPGTGRTGTIITCDIALRSLEMPKRIIDIPQFVYYVRRGRASAVQTKEQYEFIYKVAHMYATKISGPINDN